MNELYRDHLVTSAKKMMFLARDAEKCPHQGVKGRLREIFIQELLEPYLYPTMQICTGIVIDSNNKHSDQTDIIIYDSEIVPPALLKRETGYIPWESVLATIEIKSVLTSVKLKDSVDNALSIKKLAVKDKGPAPICAVFAFGSDLGDKKKSEFARLQEIFEKTGGGTPVSMVCIAGKICLMYTPWQGRGNSKGKYEWVEFFPGAEYEEILVFAGAIIDSCNRLRRTKKSINIQDYFLDFNESIFVRKGGR